MLEVLVDHQVKLTGTWRIEKGVGEAERFG